VIFVGEWRAEQCHDSVAHHLVHGALEPMDGVHHVLQHRIEDPSRVLGIAALGLGVDVGREGARSSATRS
jgi:hypothetical protein